MTIVLVTGAAGDIGTAVAEVLAQRGYRLALADHPDAVARLDETVQMCRRIGVDAASVTFDVTDEAAASAAVDALGPLAGLVNNAGFQGVFAPVDRYPIEDARRVLDVNVLGTMIVLAAAGRAEAREGRSSTSRRWPASPVRRTWLLTPPLRPQ